MNLKLDYKWLVIDFIVSNLMKNEMTNLNNKLEYKSLIIDFIVSNLKKNYIILHLIKDNQLFFYYYFSHNKSFFCMM